MSRWQVLVQSADYTSSVLLEGLEISQNITDRVSTATVVFFAQAGEEARYDEANFDVSTYSIDLREYYEITILNRDNGVVKFAGTIRQITPERKNSSTVFWKCECQDWSTLLDEYVELEVFGTSQTDKQIIQTLIGKYGHDITAPNATISTLCTLPSWEVRDKTIRQALEEIVEFSGGEWRVDWDKQLRYFRPTDYPAPFGLSSSPNSVSSEVGLVWDEATKTWSAEGRTWDETSTLPALPIDSSTLVWNNATQSWNEITTRWDDPGAAGLITYGIDAFTDYTRDAIKIINRCTVLGSVIAGGERLRVVYDDIISQVSYGIRAHTIVDDQITVGWNATLRAKSVVDDNAYPRVTVRLKTFIDGLEVGQTLILYHRDLFINGSFVIRELQQRQITRNLTEYSITAGVREPDALRLLKQIDARTRRLTAAATANPADGTVTNESIGEDGLTADVIKSVNANSIFGTITAGQIGSVNAVNIFGQITAGQIGSVNAVAIAGTITASQINTVNAQTIQGVINAGQIGSVNATTIQGVIISSQVADGLFDRLALFNGPLRPVPNQATPPALPDNINFPLNSFYYNTTDGKFYKNVQNLWTLVTEGQAVSGKLEYYHIGTIKATSIIGVILAAQIGSITAGQITGQITASQIGTVNASAVTGQIVASQISTVNASSIQGTISAATIGTVAASSITGLITAAQIGSISAGSITVGLIAHTQIGTINAASISVGQIQSTQINTVAAGQITGNITSGQIASITATQITGTLSASQIGTINASSISGTLTSTQIGSINAATITIGLIGNSQIGSMSASKLTAGTIDANTISVINLSATNITTGSFAADRIGAGTISASVTMTSPTLLISNGTITLNVDATNKFRVIGSTTDSITTMNGTNIRVEQASNANRFAQLVLGSCQVQDVAGNRAEIVGGVGLRVNFTTVVGAQRSAVASPSGGSTVDSQARAAIDAIRTVLSASLGGHGLTA